MANSNYQASAGGNWRAVATEAKARSQYLIQIGSLNPLLAIIFENEAHVNQGAFKNGTKLLVPLAYDTVSGMTGANYGRSDSQQQVPDYGNLLVIDGVTMAQFEMCYTEKAYSITPTESMVQSAPAGMDLDDIKLQSFLVKDASIVDGWLLGNQADSRVQMLGMQHVLSTSNTVGGIDQASYSWWQCQTHAASGGVLADDDLYNAGDKVAQVTREMGKPAKIDTWLLSNYAGGFNVYNKVRSFIDDKRRVVDQALWTKYGIDHFIWNGAKCFQNNKVAGQAWGLSTDNFYFYGNKTPKIARDRLDATFTEAVVVGAWRTFAVDMIRSQYKIAGITS